MKRTLRKLEGRWYFVTEGRKRSVIHDVTTGAPIVDDALGGRVLAAAPHDLRGMWDPVDRARMVGTIPRDEDWAVWRRVAQAIDDGAYDPITVPITPLRDVCALLRTLDPKESARRLAASWVGSPAELARLFLRSVEDFEAYESDERFEPATTREASAAPDSGKFAREVVSRARANPLTIEGFAAPLRYVAHEISPRRTPGGRLEGDGYGDLVEPRHNKSGAGGLDLLATGDDVFAVIEIKAAGDTSLPFALVQALMYAAELIPEAQRRRLARSYGELRFVETHPGPFADVIVIFEAATSHAADLALVVALARGLLHGPHPDATRVRRLIREIVFVEGVFDGELRLCRVGTASSSAART